MSEDLPVIEVFDGHERLAGCLPRKSKPGEWCPMAADRIPLVDRDEWDELAKNITLRPRVEVVLNQGSNGSCASESSTGAVMLSRSIAGFQFELLNPLSVYGRVNNGRDAGSSIDENLRFIRENGICPESVWPRSKGWRANPPEEAWAEAAKYRIVEFYDITSIDEFVSALLRGFPVVHGSKGHALCGVAHKGDYPEDLNSWDYKWGDGGFGRWDSYRGINWGYGVYAIRTTHPSDL